MRREEEAQADSAHKESSVCSVEAVLGAKGFISSKLPNVLVTLSSAAGLEAFLSRLLHAHLARLDVPQPESAECAADASAVAAAERLRSFETELLKGGLVEAAEGLGS